MSVVTQVSYGYPSKFKLCVSCLTSEINSNHNYAIYGCSNPGKQ